MVIRVRTGVPRVLYVRRKLTLPDQRADRRMTRPFAPRFSDFVARFVPRLTFDEPLEAEFRRWHAEHTRSRVRNAMWLAMGNMLVVMLAGRPFREMRDAI